MRHIDCDLFIPWWMPVIVNMVTQDRPGALWLHIWLSHKVCDSWWISWRFMLGPHEHITLLMYVGSDLWLIFSWRKVEIICWYPNWHVTYGVVNDLYSELIMYVCDVVLCCDNYSAIFCEIIVLFFLGYFYSLLVWDHLQMFVLLFIK